MILRFLGLCFAIAVTALPVAAFGDEAPLWLQQAAALKVPAYDKKISTVVLVDESTMTVGEDGRVITVSSYAVRILNQDGRKSAVAMVGYATDTGKVRDLRAWLIRPTGSTKAYGKDQVIDEAEINDVYDESRSKKIIARDDAELGSVFGFQVTTERRPYFNQTMWFFQDSDPVLSSKLTLVLPAGWRASGTTFNHTKIEPVVNGSSYTWELRDIPPIVEEPFSPSMSSLVARLAVNYSTERGHSSSRIASV